MTTRGSTWPTVPDSVRVSRLQPTSGAVRMVIDSDAANEIDDQFAIAYALLSPERLQVEAIYAAPFERPAGPDDDAQRPWFAAGPSEGVDHSRAEILGVLEAFDRPATPVFDGPRAWLSDHSGDTPNPSPAVEDLVVRARHGDAPLYVVAIGAATTVASALLLAPDLVDDIVVVWLGGNGTWWSPAAEHNVTQDLAASRLLLDCGVPLVHVPCRQVSEKLMTTHHEIDERVRGHGRIGDHLAALYDAFDHKQSRMKQLWDVGAVAWVAHPEWCPSALVPSPVLLGHGPDRLQWGHNPARHLVREVRDVDADAILTDLFDRLPGRRVVTPTPT